MVIFRKLTRYSLALVVALFLSHQAFILSGLWAPYEKGSSLKPAKIEVPSFSRWLSNAVSFDFGHSNNGQNPVAKGVLQRLGSTLLVTTLALLIALGFAFPLASISAWMEQNKWNKTGKSLGIFAFSTMAIPSFIVALLTKEWINNLPHYGTRKFIFGSLCIALPLFALWFVHIKAKLSQVFASDFVLYSRLRGVSEVKIFWETVLPNALTPLITLAAYIPVSLIEGAVIVEKIFDINGLGSYAINSFIEKDYHAVMFSVLLSGILLIVGLLLSDIAHQFFFKEIKEGENT